MINEKHIINLQTVSYRSYNNTAIDNRPHLLQYIDICGSLYTS